MLKSINIALRTILREVTRLMNIRFVTDHLLAYFASIYYLPKFSFALNRTLIYNHMVSLQSRYLMFSHWMSEQMLIEPHLLGE